MEPIEIIDLVDSSIRLFYEETSNVYGFGSIKTIYNLNKPQLKKLRELVYLRIDKNTLHSYLRSKQARYRNKIRNSKPITYSEDTKIKMRNSMNRFYESIKGTEYETILKTKSRESIKKIHESGAAQTEEARRKRVTSRKANNKVWHTDETLEKISKSNIGKCRSEETKKRQSLAALKKFQSGWKRIGYSHSIDTRKRLSDATRAAWANGLYTKDDHLFVSNGEKDLRRILELMQYKILGNKLRWGKSWDVICDDLKFIIEYNGTYWHFDPRYYDPYYYCNSRNVRAIDIWIKDCNKRLIAQRHGYRMLRVWQSDWEMLTDDISKIDYIHKLLTKQNIIL